MQRIQHRILTTHTGSLPRPQPLLDLLICQDQGETIDQKEFDRLTEAAVKDVINKQLVAGIVLATMGSRHGLGSQAMSLSA